MLNIQFALVLVAIWHIHCSIALMGHEHSGSPINYFEVIVIKEILNMTGKKMKVKKRNEGQKKLPIDVVCPNCNFKINVDEIGLVMFESCTVFSCPICKKTIAIQPKGKEFEIRVEDDQ